MPAEHFKHASEALSALNRRLVEAVLSPPRGGGPEIAAIFASLAAGLARDPERWVEIQKRYHQKQLLLWASLSPQKTPVETPAVAPDPSDRRFRAPEWREPYFNYLVQSYLLGAAWLTELVESAQLDAQNKQRLAFFARQLTDAMSPANFPWSNPEAIRLAADTQGESLAQGLQNLAADLEKGMVSMSDERAFEVGRNLAISPGAVVYENDFMQLLQYRATTGSVYERPLLMVPPFINKFYILDLQPENSFVRFAVENGHTVFMVSWRNMPDTMGRATWDDYLNQGVIRAIDIAGKICNTDRINVLGFCVGGTLLACALAVLRGEGRDPVASLTLLATLLDFCDPGELRVFVDEAYVRKREQDFADGGVMRGREMAITFASLRANELIWRYVANNYLKGRTPEPFDLLFWNGDSTNLPGAMYVYYVRNMYLENNLRVPRKLTMCGVPVDLGAIEAPAYLLATREDHIVPWKTAHASTRLLKGKIEFVLAASGHIAGVINPASRNRRSYWVNDRLEADPEKWLAAARENPGSWWTHWNAWMATHGGRTIPARPAPGNAAYREIEAAPGRYVKENFG